MAEIWWVNQNPKNKVNGVVANEIVWSPDTRSNGRPEQSHWRLMRDVRPGDIIVHNTDRHIVAFSVAVSAAIPALNPYPQEANEWQKQGKLIQVSLQRLETPIPITDIPLEVRKEASASGGPFIYSGEKVKQGYFFRVPRVLWNAIDALSTPDVKIEQNSDLNKLSVVGATDIERIVSSRTEQSQLRRALLAGRTEAQCGICARVVPSHYLHAAHIKPRAKASDEERKDPNIAMLACVLGCDQGFECGDIRVSSCDGKISLKDPNDQFLNLVFGELEGQIAPGFSQESARYFKAREELLN